MRPISMKLLPLMGAAIVAACANTPPQHAQQPPPDLEARVTTTQSTQPGQFGQPSRYGEGQARMENRGETGEMRGHVEAPAGASAGAETAPGGAKHATLAADKGLCPIDVPGARAQVRTSGGNVLLLVTTTDSSQVDELRRRARDYSTRTAHFSSAQGSSPAEPGKMDPNQDEQGRRDTANPNLFGHGDKDKKGAAPSGPMGHSGTMGEGVPVRITVQDVTDGVILVFAPTDSNRLDELQGLIQQDAPYLGQGRCPIGERRTSMAR